MLGFITNHGYLDNPTFRGMRWHLMQTFEKIYVLDLHGNANKKEVTPEGNADKNVFDIRQGVAILIGVKKKGPKAKQAEVYHAELWGERADKYEALWSHDLRTIGFKKLSPQAPYFMFYDVNLAALARYDEGFSVADFFMEQSTGIISARDDLTVGLTREELLTKFAEFLDRKKEPEEIRSRFFGSKTGKYLPGDSRGWRLVEKRPVLQRKDMSATLRRIQYRPLDIRWICYDEDIVDWPRLETMAHFNDGENVALLTPRMTADDFSPLVSDTIISNKTASRYDQSYFFPLYIYPSEKELDQSRRLNLDAKLYARLQKIGRHSERGAPNELQVFDYIYGVLHCPSYRSTYAEFLKIDFPRIPWPDTAQEFWDVSDKGGELRRLHLMEPQAIGDTPFPFRGDGEPVVDDPRFEDGKVWINDAQYFDEVPEIAWDFYIGGYQPAQKWLKDRKDRALSFEEVEYYQRVLKILSETDSIMGTITMKLDAAEK